MPEPAELIARVPRGAHPLAPDLLEVCSGDLPKGSHRPLLRLLEALLEGRDGGHVCIEASALAGSVMSLDEIEDLARKVPLLVLEEGHLYFRSIYQKEEFVGRWLGQRFSRKPPSTRSQNADNASRILEALALKGIALLTGGPGTGKTTLLSSVVKRWIRNGGHPARLACAAPTGRAASRLAESLQEHLRETVGVYAAASIWCGTIARMLNEQKSRRREGPVEPPEGHRLPWDLIVVDEAGMLDLEAAWSLMDQLNPMARLLLSGDARQLVSVESGAVFADSVEAARIRSGSSKEGPSPLVRLERNFRFPDESGINRLAKAVAEGDTESAESVLTEADASRSGRDLQFMDTALAPVSLDQLLGNAFGPLWEADSPPEALQLAAGQRILCPMRGGRTGTEAVNRLGLRMAAARRKQSLFHPLLIERNDRRTGLNNGDTGVVSAETGDRIPGAGAAWFDRDGQPEWLPLSALPPHSFAYGVTVHKSQGSEYGTVILVLPEEPHPILTRELVYTAITRARRRLILVGRMEVIRHALRNPTGRRTRLTERILAASG